MNTEVGRIVDSETLLRLVKPDGGDVVLDVEICRDGSSPTQLRFGTLSPIDGGYTYASRCYCMTEQCWLLDMVDDFCHGRIRFFSSSDSVQAFLLSLHLFETDLIDKHGFDLLDYYAVVNEEVVDTVNHGSQTLVEVMNTALSGGYGISVESKMSRDTRQRLLEGDGYFTESAERVASAFDRFMGEIASDSFRLICIRRDGDGNAHLVMDRTVGLPLVFHSSILFPLGAMFLKGDRSMGMVDVWKVKASATFGDIMSLSDADGSIPKYDGGFGDGVDFVVGMCDSVGMVRDAASPV